MFDVKAYEEYLTKIQILQDKYSPNELVHDFRYVLEDSPTACAKKDQDFLKTHPDFTYISEIPKYKTLSRNMHHWTTSYVWNSFIPRFCRDFDLQFDPSMFNTYKYIERENGKEYDLTFHGPGDRLDSFTLNTVNDWKMGSHTYALREFVNSPSIYHGLFRGWHQCCVVVNNSMESGRGLFLNCDSMSIPVIPILATMFKAIYVADNRNGVQFVEGDKPFFGQTYPITDYCALALARSYCVSYTFEYRNSSNNKIFKQNMC